MSTQLSIHDVASSSVHDWKKDDTTWIELNFHDLRRGYTRVVIFTEDIQKVLRGLCDDSILQGAYADGRKDQAEEQPIPEAALKLLDEVAAYLKEARYYMDEEDRKGGAHGLYEKVSKYLIDVGYTYHAKVAA